jgi:two-component system, cell cycle response regulator
MNNNELPNILLVDDRKENLLAMEMHFEDMPANIIKATSGNEALVRILEHNFAVVLMDVQMPGMDGFEAAKLMRSNNKTAHVPIIFVTAISKEKKNIFKGYEAGAVDYIFKPLDPEILKAKVNIFLDLYNQQKQIEVTNLRLNQANIEIEKANHKILAQQEKVVEEERLKVLLNLSGATAHELNQPLMVLLGNIDLIDMCKDEPEKVYKLLDNIKEAGLRISRVVKKIQTIRHYEIQPHDQTTNIINLDQSIQILCIEDSHKDFLNIKNSLKSHKDICLSLAKSLEEGWSILEDKGSRIDLIFLDFILQDGDGFTFLTKFSQKDLQIPVVVITGQGDDDVAAKLIQAGALDYLPKAKISEQSLFRMIANAMEKATLKKDLARMQEELIQTSTKDSLTGLYNRRYLLESLNNEMQRAKRYKESLSFLMIDIDHFKNINDTHGHPAGDIVLAGVANILFANIRQSDIAGRFGGEEFAIILTHTDINEAVLIAEKMRKAVQQASFSDKKAEMNVTISIGVSICLESDNAKDVIKNADKALYKAKGNGRNQVVQN